MGAGLPDTILMTADTVGGVWTYALDLARALQPSRIRIHLATMGPPPDREQLKEAGTIPGLEIHESTFKLEWMEDPWESVAESGKWLLDLERQTAPDLIHLNTYSHGTLPWKSPVLMTGHSCVLSWWRSVKKERAPETWNTYRRKVRDGLRRAGVVIGVSRFMLGMLKRYYGPFERSAVIYNARDEKAFYASRKEPVLFTMGRLWDEGKNISGLAGIADRLPWPLYVAGEDYGTIPGNRKNLHLLGRLPSSEISRWLGKTPVFVMPARYEPFGLSALEAALSGCALVLGDLPSYREIWGEAALYADPENPEEILEQTGRLADDTEECSRMAAKAAKKARSYSTERFARGYAEQYRRLLDPDYRRQAEKKASRSLENETATFK